MHARKMSWATACWLVDLLRFLQEFVDGRMTVGRDLHNSTDDYSRLEIQQQRALARLE